MWAGDESSRHVLCSAEGPPPRSLVVACDGWSWADDVPVHRVGERTIEVASLAQPQLTQRLVCEVTRPEGTQPRLDCALARRRLWPVNRSDPGAEQVTLKDDVKLLTLRSSTRLINETRAPLEVRVWQPHQAMETVHPLEPGGTLPMPLRPDTSSYRICLRPMGAISDASAAASLQGSYDVRAPAARPLDSSPPGLVAEARHRLLTTPAGPSSGQWSGPCTFPGDDGRHHEASTTALLSAGLARGVAPWHCLVHHAGRPARGVCIVRILPPFELVNLLARTLRYELRGGGAVASGMLRSGDTLAAHEFAAHTSVSMRVQVRRARTPLLRFTAVHRSAPSFRCACRPTATSRASVRWCACLRTSSPRCCARRSRCTTSTATRSRSRSNTRRDAAACTRSRCGRRTGW